MFDSEDTRVGMSTLLPKSRLKELYIDALRMRLVLDEKISMKLRGQHEIGGFFIGGMGEEIHGMATAQGIWDAMGLAVGESAADKLALFLHYRSDSLLDAALRLQGEEGGSVLDQLRQQAARATDTNAGGRQMVMHVCRPDLAVQPNQSALGMQLGKASGYAMGWKLKGETPGPVSVAILGDGTTSCSDFHEAMSAASLWDLPVLFIVTDNEVAISVPKVEGEAIVDLESYAKGFGVPFATSGDGDFESIYRAVTSAVQTVKSGGRPFLLHCPVTRFRGHSSSGLKDFDEDAYDPLVDLAQTLLAEGVIEPDEALTPKTPWPNNKTRYLANYEDNPLATGLQAEIRVLRDQVIDEPKPDGETIWEFVQPPFPEGTEPASEWSGPRSEITVAEAIRAALDRTLAEGNAGVWGQDVGGSLGGVFGCTRFLAERHPELVFNAPINEPLIIGTATGAALHPGMRLIPEIQFADYSLNTLHWMVHLGHLYWATRGQVSPNMTIRMPCEPTLTGALYHSMSVESYYAHIPSVVMVMPSNAFDAYGLLRSAAEYDGLVIFLEPKDLYRVKHDKGGRSANRVFRAGPKLPGEVPAKGDGIPEIEDYKIPFGKARQLREGADVTIVSYGLALFKADAAARQLAESGIEVDLFDLRSLVPYDREAVEASVRKTGRLLVVTEDRPNTSFVNQLIRDVHETLPHATGRIVGMKEVPATGMAPSLYRATVVSIEDVVTAGESIARVTSSPGASSSGEGVSLDNDLLWLNHAPGWSRR